MYSVSEGVASVPATAAALAHLGVPSRYKPGEPQILKKPLVGTDKNAFTIGPSLTCAMDSIEADYVLFLEKDFMLHPKVVAVHAGWVLLRGP